MNLAAESKTIVAAATAILTGLEPFYFAHTSWFPAVTAAIGVLLVHTVPNTPAVPATPERNTTMTTPETPATATPAPAEAPPAGAVLMGIAKPPADAPVTAAPTPVQAATQTVAADATADATTALSTAASKASGVVRDAIAKLLTLAEEIESKIS